VDAVADERAYAGCVQSFEPPHELALRRQAAVGSVKDIASHQQRINAPIDSQIDYPFVGLERGASQDVRHTRLDLADALERTVQMQIGCVNKAKRHVASIPSPHGLATVGLAAT
jgi:hypothetical protein